MNTPQTESSIDELFDKLRLANGRLSIGITTENDAEITKNLEEALKLSETISKKEKTTREKWFIQNSYLFCCALEQNNYEYAGTLMSDLKYFRHAFLPDSEIAKKLSNNTLKIISKYEDKE